MSGAKSALLSEQDRRFLAASVRLGRSRLGMTWPNPSVGCLIVKDGVVISHGVTGDGGRPHGERMALDRAGERARGATAYVSLEPCNHHGRTPPCTEALLSSGIARVVIALGDPDPRVDGSGFARLIEGGAEVIVEPDATIREAARYAHTGHLTRMMKARPFVTLKLALSADGAIGIDGEGQIAITSDRTNRLSHGERGRYDAIAVGSGTLRADDPQLTVRLPGLSHRCPAAVLFGGDGFAATKLSTSRPADQLIHLPGRNLADGLSILGNHGVTRLLVEGGARLAKALLKAHLVDELVLLKGVPTLGPTAIRPFPTDPFEGLDAAGLGGWTVTERRVIGPDRLMRLAAPSKIRKPMFTGIVTAIGTVDAVEDRGEDSRFTVVAPYEADGIDLGASIAHDGVCLTITSKEAVKGGVRYTFDASRETLRLTTLSDWQPGTKINLERSLRVGDEMGGHVVTGHADGMATITRREDGENAALFEIEAPDDLAPYIAKKGSVCLQGTSLTVNSVEGNRFTLMLIPHTLAVTTWGDRKVGDRMNIEIDLMARYAERLMVARD